MLTGQGSTKNDLLACLYDAVMAPSGFQGFVEVLCEEFMLKAVTMISRHAETHDIKGLWLHGIGQEWVQRYALEYAREDMLSHHIMQSPIAHFYASNLDLDPASQFMTSRFYVEWVVPQGVSYAAGAVVLHEDDWVTQLILQRAPEHPPFSREEMARLDQLVPHMQRAIQLRERFAALQFGQNFLAGGLDMLAMPTFLFDEFSRVVHYNRGAAALLKEGKVKLVGSHLKTDHDEVSRKLDLEISSAVMVSRGNDVSLTGVVLMPRTGKMPLMMMVAPLRLPNRAPGQGAALMFAFDPNATPLLTADLVRDLFNLSEAEAALAAGLCRGDTLEEIAVQRGTSINTVKTQLKNVFTKTGARRQSDLVSLLLASPAYFLAQQEVSRAPHIDASTLDGAP